VNEDCRIEHRRGRWVCLSHDVEVVPRMPDAYIHHPTAADFTCPIDIETRTYPKELA
jgi:hypothetical protein